MTLKDFHNNKILVTCLKEGDEQAYDYLIKKYHRKLKAYSISLVRDHAKAQDIVQNVLIRTWTSRKNLNPDLSIQNFLFKSIYNEFVNLYWQDHKILPLDQFYHATLVEVTEEVDEEELEDIIQLVTAEIEKLPKKCKQVFVMSKQEGLSNMEIANYLGISQKTVEAQITKGYSVLRKALKKKIESTQFFLFIINRLQKRKGL